MPNTGRPSQDCHLCRQRRVKCDLGRPGCQRCVKYGAACPGYREQHELVFRNANPLVKKNRKQRGKRNNQQAQQAQQAPKAQSKPVISRAIGASTQNSNGTRATTVTAFVNFDMHDFRNGPPVSRSLIEHWTNHSVPILLGAYPSLSFLRNAYRCTAANEPLVWAAHLFSRTYVTNIHSPMYVRNESMAETQRELGTYLGKTLSAVNAALKEPGGALRDDVMTTVWILANYELLAGSVIRTEPLSPWNLHLRGLYSILRARGAESLFTAQGREAFWPCYTLVQIQAVISDTECPSESEAWLEIIRNNLSERRGYTLYVAAFIIKCTKLQAGIRSLLQRRDFTAGEDQYESLVRQLEAAEEDVNQYVSTYQSSDCDSDLYMCNIYFSALIKGYTLILFLSNFLSHYANCRIPRSRLMAQRAKCAKMIRIAAHFILESVPVALGSLKFGRDDPGSLFDALRMIWPLTAVYVSMSTSVEQRAQARAALTRIGKEAGVRQALKTYPVKMSLPMEALVPIKPEPDDDDDDDDDTKVALAT